MIKIIKRFWVWIKRFQRAKPFEEIKPKMNRSTVVVSKWNINWKLYKMTAQHHRGGRLVKRT